VKASVAARSLARETEVDNLQFGIVAGPAEEHVLKKIDTL
jgi:hypothetical protein